MISRELLNLVNSPLTSWVYDPNYSHNCIDTLIENKRLDLLPKVIDKYVEYYRILNREENITIISAEELSEDDRSKVHDALKKSHAGVNFTLKFQVNEISKKS
jgi:F-type H+-transporting ATPase subunit O